MIQLKGTLSIKIIGGRNGDFSVGTLTTEIGEFSVKSPELDQYDQGQYEGTFGVSHIGLGYFNWGLGRHVTELKATLEFIAIDGVDELPEDFASIGEAEPEADSSNEPQPVKTKQAESKDEVSDELAPDDLFSPDLLKLIEERKTIQLDPSIGRPKFPQQLTYIKSLGYKWDLSNKQWTHS